MFNQLPFYKNQDMIPARPRTITVATLWLALRLSAADVEVWAGALVVEDAPPLPVVALAAAPDEPEDEDAVADDDAAEPDALVDEPEADADEADPDEADEDEPELEPEPEPPACLLKTPPATAKSPPSVCAFCALDVYSFSVLPVLGGLIANTMPSLQWSEKLQKSQTGSVLLTVTTK